MMRFQAMNNVLDYAHARPADPILSVRKATHAQVWSVWDSLEGTAAEEIFEALPEVKLGFENGGDAGMPDYRYAQIFFCSGVGVTIDD
jgi:hypothetical protein